MSSGPFVSNSPYSNQNFTPVKIGTRSNTANESKSASKVSKPSQEKHTSSANRYNRKKNEGKVTLQIEEEEDLDEYSVKHVAAARYKRNHQLINEIFGDTVVPDVRNVVSTERMIKLKDQVQQLTMHQKKLEAVIQQEEEEFQAKKRKFIEASEQFQREMKRLCSSKPVDAVKYQKMVEQAIEQLKIEQQKQQEELKRQEEARQLQQQQLIANNTNVAENSSITQNQVENSTPPVVPVVVPETQVTNDLTNVTKVETQTPKSQVEVEAQQPPKIEQPLTQQQPSIQEQTTTETQLSEQPQQQQESEKQPPVQETIDQLSSNEPVKSDTTIEQQQPEPQTVTEEIETEKEKDVPTIKEEEKIVVKEIVEPETKTEDNKIEPMEVDTVVKEEKEELKATEPIVEDDKVVESKIESTEEVKKDEMPVEEKKIDENVPAKVEEDKPTTTD